MAENVCPTAHFPKGRARKNGRAAMEESKTRTSAKSYSSLSRARGTLTPAVLSIAASGLFRLAPLCAWLPSANVPCSWRFQHPGVSTAASPSSLKFRPLTGDLHSDCAMHCRICGLSFEVWVHTWSSSITTALARERDSSFFDPLSWTRTTDSPQFPSSALDQDCIFGAPETSNFWQKRRSVLCLPD